MRAERGIGRTRQIAVLAAVLFAPSLALAQATTLSEPEKAWVDVQQQAAEAENAQDCALACRALQSLARATQHLCALGPEHCDEARAKLREAAERVRAACPDCATGSMGGAEPTSAPPPPAPGQPIVAESATHRGGGCAGCTTSGTEGGLLAPALALLGLLMLRRRRADD